MATEQRQLPAPTNQSPTTIANAHRRQLKPKPISTWLAHDQHQGSTKEAADTKHDSNAGPARPFQQVSPWSVRPTEGMEGAWACWHSSGACMIGRVRHSMGAAGTWHPIEGMTNNLPGSELVMDRTYVGGRSISSRNHTIISISHSIT